MAEITVERLKAPHLLNKDLKVTQSAPVRVPHGLPGLHFLMTMVGGRGTGKTTALINIMKSYEAAKTFDKVYVFSPTLHNDPKYDLIAKGTAKLSTFTSYSDEIFRDVLDEIKDDIAEWKEYAEDAKIWRRYTRTKKVEDLSDTDMLALYMMDFQEPVKPFAKFPCSLLVFDDLVGNKELYRSDSKGIFNSFVILHRHLCCSVIFLSQIFHNAVPRQIRTNISSWLLFANRNAKLKKEVAEELCGSISPEAFLALWDEATRDEHSFFMIDTDAKDKRFRYRRNLNELLVLAL